MERIGDDSVLVVFSDRLPAEANDSWRESELSKSFVSFRVETPRGQFDVRNVFRTRKSNDLVHQSPANSRPTAFRAHPDLVDFDPPP
jgi:hypothetical protein